MLEANTSATRKVIVLLLTLAVATAMMVGVTRFLRSSSFAFAWCLNFMLMMVVLMLMQTFKPKFGSAYFDSKPFEQQGRIYKWLGVEVFRKLLVMIGWEKLNKANHPVSKRIEHIRHLEYTTRQSEFNHLVIFVIVLAVTVVIWYKGGIRDAAWLLALNILLNLYPIILQRYNRPKYQRLLSAVNIKSTLD